MVSLTTVTQVQFYQTSDAKVFDNQDEAFEHERALQAGARAGEYVATLGIENKRHASRLINDISRYEKWRQDQEDGEDEASATATE